MFVCVISCIYEHNNPHLNPYFTHMCFPASSLMSIDSISLSQCMVCSEFERYYCLRKGVNLFLTSLEYHLFGRAEASPTVIIHTRKLLYLCMYVCM